MCRYSNTITTFLCYNHDVITRTNVGISFFFPTFFCAITCPHCAIFLRNIWFEKQTNKKQIVKTKSANASTRQQTSWCTRRRSTSLSQTIWTRLSQNSRHTKKLVDASATCTTNITATNNTAAATIHSRLEFNRQKTQK